jgi:hypothetical protein
MIIKNALSGNSFINVPVVTLLGGGLFHLSHSTIDSSLMLSSWNEPHMSKTSCQWSLLFCSPLHYHCPTTEKGGFTLRFFSSNSEMSVMCVDTDKNVTQWIYPDIIRNNSFFPLRNNFGGVLS